MNRSRSTRLVGYLSIALVLAGLVVANFVITGDDHRLKFNSMKIELNPDFSDPYATNPVYVAQVLAAPPLSNGTAIVRKKAVFQPVTFARRGIDFLEIYQSQHDPRFLSDSKSLMNQIVKNSTLDAHNARWLSYQFDFALHSDQANTIHAPWYSAMAEGLALSLSSRLYSITGNDLYLKEADSFFNALANIKPIKAAGSVGVSFVDENSYLWLEEYSGDVAPMRVINGHIFAIFGLADYWKVTRSSKCEQIIKGASSTVLHYFDGYRNPGTISWYGMRVQDNPHAMSAKYHKIVTGQFRSLASITGDATFSKKAELLYQDFH